MRPGVYASVMRNRKTNVRRVHSARHQYSWRRFFITLFVGAVLFVPGLIVTIIGLETENIDDLPEDSVLYKVIGPAALAFGVTLICSAGIYYCCWGFQSPVRRRHTHKHKKTAEHSEQQDPLQHPNSVPAISNQSHVTAAYASVRSKESPPRSRHDELDRINSNPTSPDFRSGRQGQHYPNHHVHPTSPKPHVSGDRGCSRCNNHRHRSSSSSSQNQHNHHPPHVSYNHHSQQQQQHQQEQSESGNQVTFVNTDAPLAQGESGSMDISIDMSTDVPTKGLKY